MSLTSYQQAVLQEMGITVWVSKETYNEQRGTEKTDNDVVDVTSSQASQKAESTPISQEEKQSKLAQLRAQMGSKAKEEASTSTASTDVQVKASKNSNTTASEKATPPAPKNVPASPEGIPLSAEQKEQAKIWLNDLQLACVQLGLPSTLAQSIMVSTSVRVDENAIIVPSAPLSLSASQKRALWQALVSMAEKR